MTPIPNDGGSYRLLPDRSLVQLSPTTAPAGQLLQGEPGDGEPITPNDNPEPLDLLPAISDGSTAPLPPIESQPRRRTRGAKE